MQQASVFTNKLIGMSKKKDGKIYLRGLFRARRTPN